MQKASPSNNYHYNKRLHSLARSHRKSMTKSAAALWKYCLSRKQMNGYSFKRERPILNYIADFVCLELLLIIEVDGWTHEIEEVALNDKNRDLELEEVGFKTLRFSSWEVLNRIDDVSMIILSEVKKLEKCLNK